MMMERGVKERRKEGKRCEPNLIEKEVERS